jgi:predicted transcriptional regulator
MNNTSTEHKTLAPEGNEVAIWSVHRFQFVSLLEIVKPFNSHRLFQIARGLEEIRQGCAENMAMFHQEVLPDNKTVILSHINNLLELISDVKLTASIKQAERVKAALSMPKCTYYQITHLTHALQNTIHDELSGVMFMHFTPSEVSLYQNLAPFGSEVAAKFPSTLFDIEEAAKCFATARYTACVFHLMRVLEIALNVVRRGLGVPDPVKESQRNWGYILGEIRKQIDANNATKNRLWMPEKDFYENVFTDLSAVKTAWRNPTMHVEGIYDEERANHILTVIKGFMQHLATKLKE